LGRKGRNTWGRKRLAQLRTIGEDMMLWRELAAKVKQTQKQT
jgi:hypothetical protein